MTIQKIFSNQSDEEKYYSVLMSEEELKLFSKKKKKEEAYGDIDEQAPEDPYYHEGSEKWGKRIGIGGAAATGAGLLGVGVAKAGGSKQGYEALDKIRELNREIKSAEFYSKDHFGHAGSGDWFDQQLQETRSRMGKKIDGHKKEIEELMSKNKGKIRAAKLHGGSTALVGAGIGTAALGAGLWAGAKLGKNARRADKKDRKDVIVQAYREINKDKK